MPEIVFESKKIKLSNLSKLLWPKENIAKSDLIKYYAEMAPYILPHLKDRPLVFTRYPNGICKKSFYQKNLPDYAPKWIRTFEIAKDKKTTKYMIINDAKSLIWAANQACIEIHPWLSRINSIDNPDYVVFDLDPMVKTNFEDARKIALAIYYLLKKEGLESFPKTSGATGLQIYVPILPKYTYAQAREFAKLFCRAIERTFPNIASTERSIRKRYGRLYLDYMQNAKGKTIIAPYSLRPNAGAPVSCPLTWEELKNGATPDMFNINSMRKRVKQKGDLFKNVLSLKQNIDRWL